MDGEKTAVFQEKYEEAFGEGAVSPKNLIDTKDLVVRTESVTVKVAPEYGDLIETRIIDGRKYIMIRVEGDVELNGISVCFDEEAASSEE